MLFGKTFRAFRNIHLTIRLPSLALIRYNYFKKQTCFGCISICRILVIALRAKNLRQRNCSIDVNALQAIAGISRREKISIERICQYIIVRRTSIAIN